MLKILGPGVSLEKDQMNMHKLKHWWQGEEKKEKPKKPKKPKKEKKEKAQTIERVEPETKLKIAEEKKGP